MQLYYWKSKDGNFGDDMNLWFWDALMPGWRDRDPDQTLFGIGTILRGVPLRAMPGPVVFGSGTGYGAISSADLAGTRILWVRGPRTAERLRLGDETAIADPAIMLSRLDEFATRSDRSGRPVFVPHHSTADRALNWQRIGRSAGLDVVLPSGDSRQIIARLRDAPLVLAESMHAAIIADTFRTPWIPIKIADVFNQFKWRDWTDSMEMGLDVQDSLVFLRRSRKGLQQLRSTLSRMMPAATGSRRAPDKSSGKVFSPEPGALPGVSATAFLSDPKARAEDFQVPSSLRSTLRRRAIPLIEAMLIADLRRALRSRPHQSRDDMLAQRQDQIAARIEDWQRRG